MKNLLTGMALMALVCSVLLNVAQYRGTFNQYSPAEASAVQALAGMG